jgi:hypothetical protein
VRWFVIVCAVAVGAGSAQLAAQSASSSSVWSGSAQLNGSLLYGESVQRVVGARGGVSRADSLLEFSAALQTLYGDASLDESPREVVKRIWLGSLTADLKPHAPWSPFLLATVETNLEKRLASRYNAGLGVKYTARRTATTDISLSVALLDEQIRPMANRSGPHAEASRLTRWSTRLRVRHAFTDRTRVSNVVFWRPSATDIGRYLVQAQHEVAFGLSQRTALTLTLLNIYDSDAVARGARRYNDGQLLLGLTAGW